jgi:DNA polymerase III sliding clamp (beta) subunit (PCNA family)
MKFTADASAIKKALDLIRPGESGNYRFAMPHTGGVQIEARGKGVIKLTTTDLRDRWESIKVKGQQVESTGSVVIPFTRFKRLMGAMKDEAIEAEMVEGVLRITSGKTTLTIKPSTTEKMPSAPLKGVSAAEVRLHGGALNEALLFASKDEHRPVLHSVFYDGGSYVSTDSYRLSMVEVPEHAWDGEFLIPRPAAEAMCRLGDPKFFTAWTDQTHMWTDHGDAQVVCRLRDGNFPGYKSLIPDGKPSGAKITEELRDAALKIHRLSKALGRNKWSWDTPVKITQVDSTTVMLAMNSDESTIEIKALGHIEHEVGFNPQFLADFFEGTNVDSMFGQDSLKPWGIEEAADYCAGASRMRLLMPVHTR